MANKWAKFKTSLFQFESISGPIQRATSAAMRTFSWCHQLVLELGDLGMDSIRFLRLFCASAVTWSCAMLLQP